jgi:hypothetical protein
MKRLIFPLLGILSCFNSMAAAPGERLPLRGFQIDAARLPEKLEYYRRFIDFASERGINCILSRDIIRCFCANYSLKSARILSRAG